MLISLIIAIAAAAVLDVRLGLRCIHADRLRLGGTSSKGAQELDFVQNYVKNVTQDNWPILGTPCGDRISRFSHIIPCLLAAPSLLWYRDHTAALGDISTKVPKMHTKMNATYTGNSVSIFKARTYVPRYHQLPDATGYGGPNTLVTKEHYL